MYGVNPASPLVRRRAANEPVYTSPGDTAPREPKVYYTMTNPDPWKPTGPGGPVAELLVSVHCMYRMIDVSKCSLASEMRACASISRTFFWSMSYR